MEGTSSYGSGFTHAAQQAGLAVVEVSRPDKPERRRIGKSDPIDAYAAARAVVSGRATSAPKDGTIAGIRALQTAARSAIKARAATLNQITHLLVTAPDAIRAKYTAVSGDKRVSTLARLRPATDPAHAPLLTALRTLVKRVQNLTEEHTTLTVELDQSVTILSPGLRAAYGVGPDTAGQLLITAEPARLRTEASFAALCGAAPVPASSGKTNRHRLSRGGDRAANAAYYRIALVRMARCPAHPRVRRPTDQRRAHEGDHPAAQTRDSPRGLPALDHPGPSPRDCDLRPTPEAKNITLTAAANHFGVWPAVISNIERGLRRDDAFSRCLPSVAHRRLTDDRGRQRRFRGRPPRWTGRCATCRRRDRIVRVPIGTGAK